MAFRATVHYVTLLRLRYCGRLLAGRNTHMTTLDLAPADPAFFADVAERIAPLEDHGNHLATGHLALQRGDAAEAAMPPLDPAIPRYAAFKRRLPDAAFYTVPAAMWLALAVRHRSLTLPSAANPAMEAGGLWGESKAQGQRLFGPMARTWLAPWILVERTDAPADVDAKSVVAAMTAESLAFPVMLKPDRGYQGWGVKKARDEADLAAYLERCPAGCEVLVQDYVDLAGEAGIFYIRHPGETRGRIVSLALTYGPHVVGDGHSTLAALIKTDPVLAKNATLYFDTHASRLFEVPAANETVALANCRSARMGAVYRDARHFSSEALARRIDAIARDIEGFHFGRFDVRFSSIEQFVRGEDFVILELNGAGAEMLHFWDGRSSLRQAYRALWWQYRTAFAIGAANVRRGHRPFGALRMLAYRQRQERLRRLYPASG